MPSPEYKRAAARAADSTWRQARADAVIDPECRFAEADPTHRCTDEFGRRLTPDTPCHQEARAQLADDAAIEAAEAAGLPDNDEERA